MWRIIAILTLLAVVSDDASSLAQTPPAEPKSEMQISPALAVRMRGLRFRLLSGRVIVGSTNLGSNISTTSNNAAGGSRERLQIDVINGLAAVHYQNIRGADEILVDVTASERLTIRHTRNGTTSANLLSFSQQPGEPLLVETGNGSDQRKIRAHGLWHLLLAEPELCRQELIPILEMLHPNWRLAATATSIEQAMLQRASHEGPPNQSQWATLVEQLASPRFAERMAADRELRRGGQLSLTYLQTIDRSRLDAEQRSRIREILTSLSDSHDDTLESAVNSMWTDRQIWLTLLAHDDESQRRIAADYLKRLIGKPLEFDPAADAATRRQQVDQLREQFDAAR